MSGKASQDKGNQRERQVLTMSVPGEPVAKGRPRVVRAGKFTRTYTPKKTLRYEETIAEYAREQIDAAPENIFPLDGPVLAEITAVFKRPKSRKAGAMMDRKPDIDNVVKAILDGLSNGGALQTDSRVVEIRARKEYGLPETRVRLFTLDATQHRLKETA